MKFLRFAAAVLVTVSVRAAVPPPAQLFPQDTLILATVPDWTAAGQSVGAGSMGRLWQDPSMKPFRGKFEERFREQILGSIEKDLGLKSEDLLPLLQGQVSVGVLKADWNPADEDSDPTIVVVADTKDKSDQLRTRLAEVRQKLVDSQQTLRTDKIREVDLTTVIIERPAPPAEEGEEPGEPTKVELTFGQVGSALVAGTSLKGLDRVVTRLTGGQVPSLAELPDYQTSEAATGLRDGFGFVFLQVNALVKVFMDGSESDPANSVFGIRPDQALAALGLDGLRSATVVGRQTEAGFLMPIFVALPESKRTGIFKLLSLETKDSAPPSFVPADAVDFQRIRINGQQLWTGLEGLVQKISPQAAGVLQMALGTLGKDQDPNFDFRKRFFGNLSDDIVTYQKAPKGTTFTELQSPPAMTLVGAVNVAEMISALKTVAALLPGGSSDLKEREVNGKKVFAMQLPTAPGQPQRALEVAPGSGYVAIANDSALMEEFLRSSETPVRPLRETPGLAEAAQVVGGMSTGLFGFQNQRESAKAVWDALRSEGGLSMLPGVDPDTLDSAENWADFTLLPPYEQVAKYFGISVSAAAWTTDGLLIRTYSPTAK